MTMSLKIKMACKILVYKPFRSYLWCGAGLNRRHKDFQSFALPTELPHRVFQALTAENSYIFLIRSFQLFRPLHLDFRGSPRFRGARKNKGFYEFTKSFGAL